MDFEQSDTGNWNIAKGYSNEIILNHIKKLDYYKDIACYGSLDIVEELTLPIKIKSILRLKGLDRYVNELKKLIENVKFGIYENQKEILIDYLEDLKMIRTEFFPKLKIQDADNNIIVNEDVFDVVFSVVTKMEMDLKEPMNKADMIYQYKETYDPKALKQKMMEQLSEEA